MLTSNLSHYGLGYASLQRSGGAYAMTTNSGANIMLLMAEWDNDYEYIAVGTANVVPPNFTRDGKDCYNIEQSQGCSGSPPTSAEAGFNDLLGYLQDHVPVPGTAGMPSNGIITSVPGDAFYDHYSAWMPSTPVQIIGHENGAGTGNWQAHLAFSRGAARQFGWEWLMDYSSWYGDSARATLAISGSFCPCCGHSDLLAKRHHYLAWMGGANYIHDEGGSFSYFQTSETNGYFDLTSAGQIMQTLHDVASTTDRGTPFVPIGVVLNLYHGMGFHFSDASPLIWDSLPIGAGTQDWHNYNTFNQVLWPDAFLYSDNPEAPDETQNIVNTPYGFSDAIDVVLENASPSVLSQFRILVLTGDVALTSTFVGTIDAFLQGGGTVILNPGLAGNAGLFTPGAGHLYAPGGFSAMAQTLASSYEALAPILVSSGAVSYQIADQGGGSYLVALYNNLGVNKAPSSTTCETVDHGYDTTVTIANGAGGSFSGVKLVEGANAPTHWNASSLEVIVPAGDVTVLQIATGP